MNHCPRITASSLLKKVFIALRAKIEFLVLRNYESLPDHWDNDIDILVLPENLKQAHTIICNILNLHAGAASTETLIRINFRATRVICSDRLLHIDLYSAMSKAWIIYADTHNIMNSRRNIHPLFDVPSQIHEHLLIAAKELFAYGHIRRRYFSRLTYQNLTEVKLAAHTVFGSYMTESGLNLVIETMKYPDLKGRPQLKFRSILRPKQALLWIWQRKNSWQSHINLINT